MANCSQQKFSKRTTVKVANKIWTPNLIKYLLTIGCVCFCFHYVIGVLVIYAAFPTAVTVDVIELKSMQDALPGVTICDNDVLNLGPFRNVDYKMFKKVTKIMKNKRLKRKEKHILKHAILEPVYERYVQTLKMNDYFNFTIDSIDFLESIRCDHDFWKEEKGEPMRGNCKNFVKIRTIEDQAACFVLFHESAVIASERFGHGDKDNHFGSADNDDTQHLTGIHILRKFNFVTNQVVDIDLAMLSKFQMNTKIPKSGKIMIHSNREMPAVSTMGYHLFPGKKYTFHIKRYRTVRLKSPYETKCRNYSNEYNDTITKKNVPFDISLPISRQSCINKCIASEVVANCHCWPSFIPYPKYNRSHETNHITWCGYERSYMCSNEIHKKCEASCQLDCVDDSFTVKVKEEPITSPATKKMFEDMLKNAKSEREEEDANYELNNIRKEQEGVNIRIIYETSEMVIHQHKPCFELAEILCEIGGLLGIFVGVSVIRIYDFLELAINKLIKTH